MIYEGVKKMKIQGTLAHVADQSNHYKLLGWKVRKAKKKIDWPYFWRSTWSVTLVKDIIVKGKHIIETPLKDIL